MQELCFGNGPGIQREKKGRTELSLVVRRLCSGEGRKMSPSTL